jgi:hypothetical protein
VTTRVFIIFLVLRPTKTRHCIYFSKQVHLGNFVVVSDSGVQTNLNPMDARVLSGYSDEDLVDPTLYQCY